MNVILLGPPGAGKGTQAEHIHQQYGLAKLATGDMLRACATSGTAMGDRIKAIMAEGALVPDDVMVELIRGRIQAPDCLNGFILDGFPRTIPQAEALDVMLESEGKRLTAVIELQVNDTALVERIAGRFACAKCGAGYHDAFKRPNVQGVCDVCGADTFFRREDDKPETVAKRLEAYNRATAPLLPYYRERGLLRTIDGMAPIAQVTQAIEAILGDAAKQLTYRQNFL